MGTYKTLEKSRLQQWGFLVISREIQDCRRVAEGLLIMGPLHRSRDTGTGTVVPLSSKPLLLFILVESNPIDACLRNFKKTKSRGQ